MIKMTRSRLKREINKTLKSFNIGPESIRGSFKGDNFHFMEDKNVTFSDIDLMIDRYIEPSNIHNLIEAQILKATGVYIPVSIHKSNCLSELSLQESQDLAVLECIYQSTSERFIDPNYQLYIRCKFAILISRVSVQETYKEVINRLNSDQASLWIKVKYGMIFPTEIPEIEFWPAVDKSYSFWHDFFHGKTEDFSHLSIHYHSVMGQTSLPISLKTRIEEKLLSNGINYNG